MRRSPATTGPANPSPIFFSHSFGGPSLGQLACKPVSLEVQLRLGPRNCGQSAPVIKPQINAAKHQWKNSSRQDMEIPFLNCDAYSLIEPRISPMPRLI